MADEIGQRVGDYEVLAKLGVGGMGRVYKVRNVISNRQEAMKILLPDFAADPDLAARFMAEIRTLAGLEHPGIAQLRTAFQIQNQFVMIMEYVEGTTLEKLASQIRLPLDHVLDYAGQVLAALSYAHTCGVTHRDIKPANIMITTHGLVKLMDFGIAKSTDDMSLTRPGTTMGSVYYMSPEQVRGGTVDARSDIYSFGVTLYELLTGRKPFQADTSYTVLNAQLNEPPTPLIEVNPAVPAALNEIVLRAMAKRPEDRFQTADEFRDALKVLREAHASEAPVMAAVAPEPPLYASAAVPAPTSAFPAASAAPPSFAPLPPVSVPPPPAGRGHRGLWIGIGAAAALLALIAAAAVLPRVFSTHASPQAASQSPTQNPAQPDPQKQPDTQSQTQPQSQPDPQASSAVAANANPTGPAPADSPHPASDSSAASPKPKHAAAESSSSKPEPPAQADAQSTPAGAPASTPVGPTPQDIRQARDRFMNLDARAGSADSGVQQIRSQQQAQGLDLRGDILAAMTRMRNDMTQANNAIARKDLEAANDYMERADHEIATLEKFLGH
jgi:eukaryotic-like serine/threonine-protein kinase